MWKTDAMEATEAADAADAADAAADATYDGSTTDAEAAADDAAAATDYASEDPAYDRSNWSAAERQRVENLETAYENASIAAQQAVEEAAENARKKLPPEK